LKRERETDRQTDREKADIQTEEQIQRENNSLPEVTEMYENAHKHQRTW